jgi:SpoVK/Ycf46/Vps4 family AAA+-type ATPase
MVELFKKIANKDSKGFIQVSLDLIKKEQDSKHFKVSSSLTRLIEQIQDNNSLEEQWKEEFSELPMDRDRALQLIQVTTPKSRLHQIILNADNKKKINRILLEWRERTALAQHGLKPIRRVLFFGPSGCGKTFCASVIAGEMDVPLLTVKTDALVSSLLGETSINLRKIFETLTNKQVVLFFDEFDGIAKARTDFQEHGEIRRAVSNLLTFIENSPSNVLVIAATNHQKLLDSALWRRFDEIVAFNQPTRDEIMQLIELKLQNFNHDLGDISEVLSSLEGFSHAEIERVCFTSIKNAILQKKETLDRSMLEIEILEIKKRQTEIQET